LLFPAIQLVGETSRRTHCVNNLRQIGLAYNVFLDDHKGKTAAFKGDAAWMESLKKYLDNRDDIFVCPSDMRNGAAIVPTGGTPPEVSVAASPTPGGPSMDMEHVVIVVKPRPGGGWSIEAIVATPDKQLDWKQPSKANEPESKPPPAAVVRPSAGAAKTSYGVNAMAEYFGQSSDGQKVLAVEYHKVVVNVFGASAFDFWPTDAAPRHHGVLNVLYKNRTVQSLLHYDIDPRLTGNYNKYWAPESMRTD